MIHFYISSSELWVCSNVILMTLGIIITYFVPDKKKSGGAYHTASGRIKKIDTYEHKIILDNGTQIDVAIL